MSHILKTRAIVLRVSPFSRTSHIVTWITEDFGRLATTVKGAMRPKSAHLGQYDLFTSCELLFYERERGDLHYIKECATLDHHPAIRSNWRAAMIASYLSDVMLRLGPAKSTEPCLYSFMAEALDILERDGGYSALLCYADMKLLRRLGLTPRVASCAACDRDMSQAEYNGGFSCAQGGILCHSCAERHHMETVSSSSETAAILQRWCGENSTWPGPIESYATERELTRIIGLFMRYHLDLQLLSRDIALRTLAGM